MSILNRKDARAGLIAQMQAIPAFEAVHDHLPKDLEGKSPVCTVESGPAVYRWEPAHYNTFQFIVGVWVRRDDAGTAEDLLDDLAQDVAEAVYAWHTAEFVDPSAPDYEEIDGVLYRVEWFFVSVEWE